MLIMPTKIRYQVLLFVAPKQFLCLPVHATDVALIQTLSVSCWDHDSGFIFGLLSLVTH